MIEKMLNINEISLMPKSLKTTILEIKNITDKDYLMNNFSAYEDEEIPEPIQIDFIDGLEFIIGYGRGYWPGIDEEFTLVRLKHSGEYIWVYTDYEKVKTYRVPKESLDTIIFEMDSSQQRQYFSNLLSSNKEFPVIPGDIEKFSLTIWSEIARENRRLRDEFNKLIEIEKNLIKKQELDAAIKIFEKTPGLTNLEQNKGKIIVEFGDKQYEIKIKV